MLKSDWIDMGRLVESGPAQNDTRRGEGAVVMSTTGARALVSKYHSAGKHAR